MLLSAQSIEKRIPLTPIHPRTRIFGMSYGLSACGYDVRVEFDEDGLVDCAIIKPKKLLLASTVEFFQMPIDVVGVVHDKSSWARRGLTVQNTVIEPGWHGYLTLELINHSDEDIMLERGMPIAQILFHLLDEPTVQPYEGKYQNQKRGPVEAINDKG